MAAATTITNNDAVEAVAKANGEFGNVLYAKLATGGANAGGNVIMSPFSVSAVLSMALTGAKGKTQLQMAKGLALHDEKSAALLGPGYKEALGVLKSNENFTLSAANRIYAAVGQKLEPAFVESVETNYMAKPVPTDFAKSEEARQTINAWVEEQTHEKIKDLIASGMLTPLTRMVLVNAVYFKGNWAKQFDPQSTTKEDFHVTPDNVVKADMMHQTAEFGFKARISELLNSTALEMPYKGDRLSMIFIMPHGDKKLAQVEEAFTALADVSHVLDFQRQMKTEVALPKFKVESKFDLGEPLKQMGMTDMFDETTADFSGMTGSKDLYVSAVVQKAFVEVNEEGAEAAAATAMIMMTRAMIMTPVFVANRPFMFFIRDKLTGLILFSGRVTDPTK